jgi:beta-lactamase regulating signal transducer with metallopeptidase domain
VGSPVFDSPLVQTIGWALIRFIWQGTLIGAASALTLRLIDRHKAEARYVVACCGLGGMLLAPVLTVLTADIPQPAQVVSLATAPRDIVSLATMDRIVSVSVIAWMAGVVFLSIRLIVSYIGIERMRRATQDVDKAVLLRLDALARRLGVRRTVRVFASNVIRVPAVVGTFRPVILLPISVVTGLPAAHLDAVLAHELAHVRRHDYFVNALQAMVETLLFYHPAVWWCSRQIRIEREHCCDDLVVESCGDRVGYATALAQLEELRGLEPMLSLNATGGRLIDRIRRLLGYAPVNERGATAWIVIAGLTVTVVAVIMMPALTIARADDGRAILQDDVTLQEPPAPPVPPPAPRPPLAPVPPVAAVQAVPAPPDAPPAPPAPPEARGIPAPLAFSAPPITPVPPRPPAPPLIPAPLAPLADRPFAPPAPPAPPLPPADIAQIDPDVIAREMQRASEQLTRGLEDLRRATEEVNAKQEALHQAQAELAKMQVETLARNTQIDAIRKSMAELSASVASSRLNELKEDALRQEIEAIRKQMEKLRAR